MKGFGDLGLDLLPCQEGLLEHYTPKMFPMRYRETYIHALEVAAGRDVGTAFFGGTGRR